MPDRNRDARIISLQLHQPSRLIHAWYFLHASQTARCCIICRQAAGQALLSPANDRIISLASRLGEVARAPKALANKLIRDWSHLRFDFWCDRKHP